MANSYAGELRSCAISRKIKEKRQVITLPSEITPPYVKVIHEKSNILNVIQRHINRVLRICSLTGGDLHNKLTTEVAESTKGKAY
jgi:hypothetical protein